MKTHQRICENALVGRSASKKFENAFLFLRLGLPSTLTRIENGAFRKRPSNQRNLKTSASRFSLDGKHFENDNFAAGVFLKHKSNMTADCCVFKFL